MASFARISSLERGLLFRFYQAAFATGMGLPSTASGGFTPSISLSLYVLSYRQLSFLLIHWKGVSAAQHKGVRSADRALHRQGCDLPDGGEAIMKSCLSLLAALLVMVLLAAAGYWAYQKSSAPANQNGHVLTVLSGDTSLTLTNATAYVLTVTMRQGASLVRFQLAPGKSETRSFPPGTYKVDGSLRTHRPTPFRRNGLFKALASTTPIHSETARPLRSGDCSFWGALMSSGNSQTSPANRRPSNLYATPSDPRGGYHHARMQDRR